MSGKARSHDARGVNWKNKADDSPPAFEERRLHSKTTPRQSHKERQLLDDKLEAASPSYRAHHISNKQIPSSKLREETEELPHYDERPVQDELPSYNLHSASATPPSPKKVTSKSRANAKQSTDEQSVASRENGAGVRQAWQAEEDDRKSRARNGGARPPTYGVAPPPYKGQAGAESSNSSRASDPKHRGNSEVNNDSDHLQDADRSPPSRPVSDKKVNQSATNEERELKVERHQQKNLTPTITKQKGVKTRSPEPYGESIDNEEDPSLGVENTYLDKQTTNAQALTFNRRGRTQGLEKQREEGHDEPVSSEDDNIVSSSQSIGDEQTREAEGVIHENSKQLSATREKGLKPKSTVHGSKVPSRRRISKRAGSIDQRHKKEAMKQKGESTSREEKETVAHKGAKDRTAQVKSHETRSQPSNERLEPFVQTSKMLKRSPGTAKGTPRQQVRRTIQRSTRPSDLQSSKSSQKLETPSSSRKTALLSVVGLTVATATTPREPQLQPRVSVKAKKTSKSSKSKPTRRTLHLMMKDIDKEYERALEEQQRKKELYEQQLRHMTEGFDLAEDQAKKKSAADKELLELALRRRKELDELVYNTKRLEVSLLRKREKLLADYRAQKMAVSDKNKRRLDSTRPRHDTREGLRNAKSSSRRSSSSDDEDEDESEGSDIDSDVNDSIRSSDEDSSADDRKQRRRRSADEEEEEEADSSR